MRATADRYKPTHRNTTVPPTRSAPVPAFPAFATAARLLRPPRLLAGILLLLAACAPGAGLAPLPDTPAGPYRLGIDEEVRVITFGEDRLSGQFRVSDRGTLALPLLGAVPADGRTTAELEQAIARRLKEKDILVDPSVSVEVVTYRPVFILGEVAKPGQYPYQPGMTVLTAVAVAGGFTYRAETGYASILRTIGGHAVEGRVPRGMELRPGDVVTVFERYF
jgi:polysaccharide export outer membrane protein